MGDYEKAYEWGYQSGRVIDIGIWMLLGYLIIKFVIKPVYENNNEKKMSTAMVLAGVTIIGLIRALMIFL